MKNFNKYLTIGAVEERWGFYVNTVGYSKCNQNEIYPNTKEHPPEHIFTWNKGRILNGYYLVFISKGEGVFESSHTPAQKVSAGSCFFLFPEIWHRYKPYQNSGWEEYWVGFNGDYPKRLMENNFFDVNNPIINTGLNDTLLGLFHKLIDTVKMATIGYYQIITGITLEILGLVNAVSNHEDSNNDPAIKLILKAKFLMQESIDNNIDMAKMVRQLPMGYSKFRKIFKETTGFAPNQYYLDIRLNKAKDLLQNTLLNIDEIAYQTGFDSPFYFSKLFKKKNGKSPLSYRKDHERIFNT